MSITRRNEAASVTASVLVIGLMSCVRAHDVAAQDRTAGAAGRETAETEALAEIAQPTRGPWWTLWSWRTPHDRIVAGMITTHLYELDETPANNQALGVVYKGVVGATFITTHGPRGFVLALERAWLEAN